MRMGTWGIGYAEDNLQCYEIEFDLLDPVWCEGQYRPPPSDRSIGAPNMHTDMFLVQISEFLMQIIRQP